MRKRNKFFPAAQAAIKASAACLLVLSLAACPGDDDNGNGNGNGNGNEDTTAPTFTVTPRDGATSAEAATNITITANEAIRNIDDSAITSTNVDDLVTLTEAGTAKAFDATIAGNAITIDPTSDFAAGSTVVVTLARVEDQAGNPSRDPASTASFTIISGSGPVDTTAPTFTVTPANGAIDVPEATNITITASESIRNIDDSAITSTNVDGLITLTEDGTDKAFDATIAGNVITINPSTDFAAGSMVTVTLGQVEDQAGNPSEDPALTASFTISSTPDTTAPTFTVTPADGATDVAEATNITITASEAIRMLDDSAITNDNVDELITLTEDGTAKAFDATIAGNVITINPSTDFAAGSTVMVTLAQLEDQAGNPSADDPALTASFTIISGSGPVDTTAPTFSVVPLNDAINVAEATNITITASEAIRNIDDSAIDSTNVDGLITLTETPIGGTAATKAFDATIAGNVITINPSTDFAAGSTVMVTLAQLEDQAGNPSADPALTASFTISFLEELAGGTTAGSSKIWYFARDATANQVAMGVWDSRPSLVNALSGSGAGFAIGGGGSGFNRVLIDAPCVLDDQYTFEMVDSSTMRFVVNTNDTFWRDQMQFGGHQDNSEGCETEVVSADDPLWQITRTIMPTEMPMLPMSSRTDGMPDVYEYRNKSGDSDKGGYTFSVAGSAITLNGRGHYIGLQAKSNAGDAGWLVPETRTFTILELSDTDDVDTMTLEMATPTQVWILNLRHYGGTTPVPDVPMPPPPACSGTNENVALTSASPTIDFESSYPSLTGFGGGNAACDPNPASGGINTSSQVVKIVKDSAETFTGVFFDLVGTLDIRDNCGFKVKAYGEAGTTLSFKVEIPGGISNEISTSVNPPAPSLVATNAWEEFSYDFSGIIPADRSNVFTRIVFFPNLTLDASGNTTIYIDDITVDTSIGPCGG